jgi:hypothetical protein
VKTTVSKDNTRCPNPQSSSTSQSPHQRSAQPLPSLAKKHRRVEQNVQHTNQRCATITWEPPFQPNLPRYTTSTAKRKSRQTTEANRRLFQDTTQPPESGSDRNRTRSGHQQQAAAAGCRRLAKHRAWERGRHVFESSKHLALPEDPAKSLPL